MGKETKRVRTCGLFLLHQLIGYSPPSQVGALGAGDTAVRKATRRPCPDGADHLVGDPDTEDRWGREQRDFHRGEGLQSEKAKAQ